MKHLVLAVLAAPAVGAMAPAAHADHQPTPRELTAYLPADTPLVVDLYDGAACFEALRGLVEPLPRGLPKQVAAVAQALPLVVKATTGMTPEDLLTVLAPGQVTAAFFPASAGGQGPFPVVMSRVEDPEEIRRLAKRLGKRVPFHVQGRVLTVSNNQRNLEAALRFRGSGRPSLLENRRYIQGRAELRPGASLRLYVDLAYIRRIRGRGFYQALPGLARLLVGPLAHVLDTAGRADARLDLLADRLALSGCLDATATAVAKKGPPVSSLVRHGASARLLPPAPAGTIAALYLDRDVTAFFGNADNLLDEDAASKVKQFLSVANQFLGSLDFRDGLLAAVDLPGAIFVTDTAPESKDQAAQPRVSLPAFTLVAPLTGHQQRAAKRALTRAFESIGFIATNERRRNKRYPIQVRPREETRGEHRLLYLAHGEWDGPGKPPLDMGFGVTLLFTHDHLVLSSTRDGAVRAADAMKGGSSVRVGGDDLRVSGKWLAHYLAKNQEVLALDRVLKEGDTLRQANQFWNGATAVLRILEAEANVTPGKEATSFSLLLLRVPR